jgi:hypothetical protein
VFGLGLDLGLWLVQRLRLWFRARGSTRLRVRIRVKFMTRDMID